MSREPQREGTKLLDEFQINGAERSLRIAYLRLDQRDIALLRGALPIVERNVDQVVGQFYEHLFAFAQPRAFLEDPRVLQRVKEAQCEYLLDLFRGEYDEAYFERRLQIGVAHQRIDLPAKLYLGGNAIFLQLLVPLLAKTYRFRPWRIGPAIQALTKVINLDEQLVMDTYIGTMVEKVRGLSQQILHTIEILTPTARKTAEDAESAASAAGSALQLAEEGTNTVQQAFHSMSDLKEKASAAVEQIMSLAAEVKNIEEIVGFVRNVTTETNMLALNAEVQAARAGDSGKGFGVVAEEIRKLADKSQQSLERIQALVEEIHAVSHETVEVSEANTRTVEEGTRLTRNISDAFNRLAASSRDAFGSVQSITSNAKQQAQLLTELQQMVDAQQQTKTPDAPSITA